MTKWFNPAAAILLGVIVFLIGCVQPAKYENAKASRYEVDATIVEAVKKEETDSEGSYTSTSYTVYADYEVDGEKYTHVKVGKYHDTDEYYVGKTIKVVINPNAPCSVMFEGGILGVIGSSISLWGILLKTKRKKAA